MIKITLKAHPIMILRLMKPYIFVLVLPLLRALIQYITSGQADSLLLPELIAFGFVLSVAILGWRAISITLNDRYITVKKGVFIKSYSVIELSRLSSVSLKQNLLDYMCESVDCLINTEAGTPQKSDFKLKMHKTDAVLLFKAVYGKEKKVTVKFSAYRIALLAATTSSAATGIIVGVPIINKASDLVGVAISDMLLNEINNVSSHFNNIFPPIVNTVTVILLLAYAVSALISFFKNVNFKLRSGKSTVEVRSGIITRKRIIFKKSKINNICFEQSPLMRLFKIYSMRASIGGYGDKRGEKAVVVPVARREELERQLKQHFPLMKLGKVGIQPKRSKAVLGRFLYMPMILALIITATSIIPILIVPYFDRLILFIGLVALGIDLYYASVCYRNYKRGELRFDECVLATGSKGFKVREMYCEKNKIGVIKILQTPADKKFKTCKVTLTVRSENADSVCVKNVALDSVAESLNKLYNLNINV